MKLFLCYFLMFFIYSVIGWMVESVYVSCQEEKFVNRGFLIGPYCPIYGCGSLLMILYLEQYKDNLLTVFVLGVVICSVLEYLTSYLMEVCFKTRWWDYSEKKFNLNGRICGENAILFGIGGVIVIYLFQPMVAHILRRFSETALLIIAVCCLVIFVSDLILSLNVVSRFKQTITNLEVKKDSTQDFSKMVRETILNNHKIFQSRLLAAFPNIDLKPFATIKEELKEELKELLKK